MTDGEDDCSINDFGTISRAGGAGAVDMVSTFAVSSNRFCVDR